MFPAIFKISVATDLKNNNNKITIKKKKNCFVTAEFFNMARKFPKNLR